MDNFEDLKDKLIDKIFQAGTFGYALYTDEVKEFLSLHFKYKNRKCPQLSVTGLSEFACNLVAHGVPVHNRNRMLAEILRHYVKSLNLAN